jgi:hypothetical protein
LTPCAASRWLRRCELRVQISRRAVLPLSATQRSDRAYFANGSSAPQMPLSAATKPTENGSPNSVLWAQWQAPQGLDRSSRRVTTSHCCSRCARATVFQRLESRKTLP